MRDDKIVFSMLHFMPHYTKDEEEVVAHFPLPKDVKFEDLKIAGRNADLPLFLKLNGNDVEVWSPPRNAVGGVFVVEEKE